MHELSLAESLLQLIEEAAIKQNFTRVKTVWLELGQLTCVEQESLRFYFDVITQDSIAQQAKLEFIAILGHGVCDHCHRSMFIASHHTICSHCGSYALTITQGEEMRIKELEVE
ncbi:MAG TPA: hydrogenase maturation nickel metallochaperone HypA [Nitrosomonas sp.]|jgi:hydrogenase nickel incorporation protein HypA/HybF|nr:hydrogenase maturation nickel metallochaperone HypA [Nitrosomonas sp.]MBP9870619.1 hydrogenase maturation nickel metallochaperone HypA [Nitrosomonas sp.]HQV89041.1 hydrogenase maturation nickel metallochaperone HypA [Nitrosomonas sp.]HRB96481.1 hydrogenase maturation nickel metallochaperone HypA [Nitrosomonas sp.]